MRIPCSICGAMVLPVTAQRNDGLCGQCAADPAAARAKANRARIIEGYGTPTAEAIATRLSELTEKSAKQALRELSGEQIYAFVLFADPHMECVVPRVMTETWAAQMPNGSRWGGAGWYEDQYMVSEDEFATISEWARGLPTGPSKDRIDVMTGAYLAALWSLRRKRVFTDSTVLLLVSSGMGDSELYSIAELLNSPAVLKTLADQLALDEEGLRAMRHHYSRYGQNTAQGACT